jgi:uncharacterized membrane protein
LEERINSGRQDELDYAKGLAIFFMIAVHGLETFAKGKIIDESAYGLVVEFFGSFTSATVFMIILGVGIVYSRKAEAQLLIKRGAMLIAVGYLLNLARGFFPMLLSWRISGTDDWIAYFMIEPFRIDILQFAGLTFIFFGLAKMAKFKPTAYLVALIGFGILNILLQKYGFYFDNIMNYKDPSFYIAAFTGLFWGTSELSSFPFLSWIFYPIVGYLFGDYLIKQKENCKNRLYTSVLIISTAMFTALLFLCWYFEIDYGWETDAAFYHHLTLGNLTFGSCAFILTSLVALSGRYFPGVIKKTFSRWSSNITEIYFIQWVLIGWIAVVTDYNQFGVFQTVILTIAVLVVSDWLAHHRHLPSRLLRSILGES